MNHLITSTLTGAALFFCAFLSFSQCENTDFEYGNFTNWSAYTGTCCGGNVTTPGVVDGRHTIITESSWDPHTDNNVSTMPPVGSGAYSVRLGNDNVGSEAESLERTFTVTNDNKLFIYQYALVLQDPDGHPPIDKPKFEVRVFDENGNIINPEECGYYQVTAGPATDTWGQNGDVRYKDWSTVGIDLAEYIGTQITIQFTVQDCGWGGHYGYAYLDASCGYLDIEVIGFCEGSNSVTLIAPDGFDSYFWPHSGETTQTVMIPMPAVGDSIEVQVTNQSGCATTILHVFEEYPVVDAGVGNDTLICAGQPVELWSVDAGQNANYSWFANGDPISEEQFLTVTPLETTVYEVIVSNPNGCFSPDSSAMLTITVDNELVFELPDDTLICMNESFALDAPLQGYTYLWTSGEDTLAATASLTVMPTDETTYTLTISNGDCSFTDSITISVFNAATLEDTVWTDFCQGAATLELSGPEGYAYQWANGATTQATTIDPYTGSPAQLQLLSPEGCADSMVYIAQEAAFPVPSASASTDTVCSGHSFLLTAVSTEPNSSFSWTAIGGTFSASGNSVLVFPVETTNYVVSAVTAGGCSNVSSFDTITVTVDTSAFFGFGLPLEICQAMPATLSSPVSGTEFEWSIGETIISADSSITVTPQFTQDYYLTVHSANCVYADYQTVIVHPVTTSDPAVIVCETASSVTIDAPTGYQSLWWPGFGNGNAGNDLQNPADGQIVPLYAINDNGCTDTIRFTIDRIAPTVLQPLQNSTVCYGDAISLTALSSYSFDQYVWTSNPAGTGASGATLNTTGLATTAYTVTVSNEYGCVAQPSSVSATVTVSDDYLLPPVQPEELCAGEEVELDFPGVTGTYTWTFEGSTFNGPSFSFFPNQSGAVGVTVSQGSCSSFALIPITVHVPESYTIAASSNAICTGDSATMSVVPAAFSDVTWLSNGNEISTEPFITVAPIFTTGYSAEITDINGCSATASTQINVTVTPKVELGPDLYLCGAPTTELKSPITPASYSYEWSTSETTPRITVSQSGNYSLTVYNGICSATDNVAVTFILLSYLGEMPNVFTPNHDNANDEFAVTAVNLEEYAITIVTRWGDEVFSSIDPSISWDGLINGEPAEEGVYFYKVDYLVACGTEPQTVHGSLTLSR
jgi:gliding motility-associated-like protein